MDPSFIIHHHSLTQFVSFWSPTDSDVFFSLLVSASTSSKRSWKTAGNHHKIRSLADSQYDDHATYQFRLVTLFNFNDRLLLNLYADSVCFVLCLHVYVYLNDPDYAYSRYHAESSAGSSAETIRTATAMIEET